MQNPTEKINERNIRAWIIVIGVLVILSLAAYAIVSAVRQSVQTAQQAIQPVTDLSADLGTRVAQVLNPTPTVVVDPITIVHQVRSLARLETIQYAVEKVITAETGQDAFAFLFGDRLLLVAHGIVIAGVDMSQLGPDDLELRENVLYVTLPEPEVFIATLDNDKSFVYDRETGLLRQSDVNLETTARRIAEDEIEKAALEDGILDLARQNAENYLYRLLIEVGNYDEVIFVRPTPEP